MKTPTVTIALLLSLLPLSALADWEGTMTMTRVRPKAEPRVRLLAVLKVKGHLYNINMTKPAKITMTVDNKTKKAWMIMMGIPMETDLSKQQDVELPACTIEGTEACYLKNGFKKTGTEKIDGHPCVIYEGKTTFEKRPATMKLWKPTDLKEVPFLKSLTWENPMDKTRYHETVLSNVKTAKIPDSVFAKPANTMNLQELQKK